MVTKQTAKSYIFVSWLIQKKSGKTPLETILYKPREGHINGAEMLVTIINRKI